MQAKVKHEEEEGNYKVELGLKVLLARGVARTTQLGRAICTLLHGVIKFLVAATILRQVSLVTQLKRDCQKIALPA